MDRLQRLAGAAPAGLDGVGSDSAVGPALLTPRLRIAPRPIREWPIAVACHVLNRPHGAGAGGGSGTGGGHGVGREDDEAEDDDESGDGEEGEDVGWKEGGEEGSGGGGVPSSRGRFEAIVNKFLMHSIAHPALEGALTHQRHHAKPAAGPITRQRAAEDEGDDGKEGKGEKEGKDEGESGQDEEDLGSRDSEEEEEEGDRAELMGGADYYDLNDPFVDDSELIEEIEAIDKSGKQSGRRLGGGGAGAPVGGGKATTAVASMLVVDSDGGDGVTAAPPAEVDVTQYRTVKLRPLPGVDARHGNRRRRRWSWLGHPGHPPPGPAMMPPWGGPLWPGGGVYAPPPYMPGGWGWGYGGVAPWGRRWRMPDSTDSSSSSDSSEEEEEEEEEESEEEEAGGDSVQADQAQPRGDGVDGVVSQVGPDGQVVAAKRKRGRPRKADAVAGVSGGGDGRVAVEGGGAPGGKVKVRLKMGGGGASSSVSGGGGGAGTTHSDARRAEDEEHRRREFIEEHEGKPWVCTADMDLWLKQYRHAVNSRNKRIKALMTVQEEQVLQRQRKGSAVGDDGGGALEEEEEGAGRPPRPDGFTYTAEQLAMWQGDPAKGEYPLTVPGAAAGFLPPYRGYPYELDGRLAVIDEAVRAANKGVRPLPFLARLMHINGFPANKETIRQRLMRAVTAHEAATARAAFDQALAAFRTDHVHPRLLSMPTNATPAADDSVSHDGDGGGAGGGGWPHTHPLQRTPSLPLRPSNANTSTAADAPMVVATAMLDGGSGADPDWRARLAGWIDAAVAVHAGTIPPPAPPPAAAVAAAVPAGASTPAASTAASKRVAGGGVPAPPPSPSKSASQPSMPLPPMAPVLTPADRTAAFGQWQLDDEAYAALCTVLRLGQTAVEAVVRSGNSTKLRQLREMGLRGPLNLLTTEHEALDVVVMKPLVATFPQGGLTKMGARALYASVTGTLLARQPEPPSAVKAVELFLASNKGDVAATGPKVGMKRSRAVANGGGKAGERSGGGGAGRGGGCERGGVEGLVAVMQVDDLNAFNAFDQPPPAPWHYSQFLPPDSLLLAAPVAGAAGLPPPLPTPATPATPAPAVAGQAYLRPAGSTVSTPTGTTPSTSMAAQASMPSGVSGVALGAAGQAVPLPPVAPASPVTTPLAVVRRQIRSPAAASQVSRPMGAGDDGHVVGVGAVGRGADGPGPTRVTPAGAEPTQPATGRVAPAPAATASAAGGGPRRVMPRRAATISAAATAAAAGHGEDPA